MGWLSDYAAAKAIDMTVKLDSKLFQREIEVWFRHFQNAVTKMHYWQDSVSTYKFSRAREMATSFADEYQKDAIKIARNLGTLGNAILTEQDNAQNRSN